MAGSSGGQTPKTSGVPTSSSPCGFGVSLAVGTERCGASCLCFSCLSAPPTRGRVSAGAGAGAAGAADPHEPPTHTHCGCPSCPFSPHHPPFNAGFMQKYYCPISRSGSASTANTRVIWAAGGAPGAGSTGWEFGLSEGPRAGPRTASHEKRKSKRKQKSQNMTCW